MEEIRRELKSSDGKAIVEYLMIELEKLKSIENIKEYSTDKAQALELKAQKKAYEKLKEILSIFGGLENTSEEKEEKEYSVR